jgi:hypothetical protein
MVDWLEKEISMVRCTMTTVTIAALLLVSSSPARSDWTRFRGPNGSGVSADGKSPPVAWSDSENLQWKVALPGPGSSSPIVVRMADGG